MRAVSPRTPPILLALIACACDGEVFSYQGVPGTETAIDVASRVPSVSVSVDVSPDLRFLLDTGAPYTVGDSSSFPTQAPGVYTANLHAFDLTLERVTFAVFDVFPQPPAETFDGILGGDLLRHFAFSLDYQGGRGWLFDPFDANVANAPEVTAMIDVPITVAGGGRALVPGCVQSCVFDVPATRVLLLTTFEGQASPVWVLVDTGASAVVLSEALYAELDAQTSGRPRLDGIRVGTINGTMTAFYTRVWNLTLEGLDPGRDPDISLDDVPVLVLPGVTLFDSLAREVGRDVKAIIGGNLLEHFWTTIDYPTRTLHLARYVDQSHIDANEFVSVGFTLESLAAQWVVADVYPDTDAANQGLLPGDVVAEIGGQVIDGRPASFVNALLAMYTLGQAVPVGVLRGQSSFALLILVQDLLPSFLPP